MSACDGQVTYLITCGSSCSNGWVNMGVLVYDDGCGRGAKGGGAPKVGFEGGDNLCCRMYIGLSTRNNEVDAETRSTHIHLKLRKLILKLLDVIIACHLDIRHLLLWRGVKVVKAESPSVGWSGKGIECTWSDIVTVERDIRERGCGSVAKSMSPLAPDC